MGTKLEEEYGVDWATVILRQMKDIISTEIRLRHRLDGDVKIANTLDSDKTLGRAGVVTVRTRERQQHRLAAKREIDAMTTRATARWWDACMLGRVLTIESFEQVEELVSMSRRDIFKTFGGREYSTPKGLKGVTEYQGNKV